MIIRYANGRTIQGVALARTDTSMRVALQGGHDVVQFSNINGRWVSEDCEPVNIGSAAAQASAAEPVSEEEFICTPDLASHLVKLLYQEHEPQEAA
jgi:hypothetical protein